MVDLATGWGIDFHRVLRTSDGGADWTDVTPHGLPAGASLEDGYALDATDLWIPYVLQGDTVAGLAETVDGGRTWRIVPLKLPTQVGAPVVDFSDAQHGWLLLDLASSMQQEQAALYATVDGGAHWTAIASTATGGALPVAGFKDVTFRNATDGWLTAGWPVPAGLALYRTTDGGHTWAQQALPGLPSGSGWSIRPPVFDGTWGAVEVAGVTTPPTSTLIVYVSSDGGATWRPTPPLRSAMPADPVLLSPLTWLVYQPDPAGAFYRSTDAGVSWVRVDPVLPHTEHLHEAAVHFVDPQHGFAWFQTPVMYRTADGGATWTATPMRLAAR